MSKRKAKFDTSRESIADQRSIAVNNNKFSVHDLLHFRPLTDNQKLLCDSFDDDTPVIVGVGCPGVGKTFLAVRLALESVLDPNSQYDNIMIVRSSVAVRDSGFIPGSIEDKDMMYEQPYRQLVDGMFKYNASYDNLKVLGKIKFNTTTYLRGQNYPERSIIIIDEIQNFDYSELCTAFSRTNEKSRVILIGDSGQTDIGRRSKETTGFHRFMKVLDRMNEKNRDENVINIVNFKPEDIVRSGIVREFYIAQYELDMV